MRTSNVRQRLTAAVSYSQEKQNTLRNFTATAPSVGVQSPFAASMNNNALSPSSSGQQLPPAAGSPSGSPVRTHSRSQLQRTNSARRVVGGLVGMSSPRSDSVLSGSFATVPDYNGGGAADPAGELNTSAPPTPLAPPMTPPQQPLVVPAALMELMRRQEDGNNTNNNSSAADGVVAVNDDTRQLVEQFLQRHGACDVERSKPIPT